MGDLHIPRETMSVRQEMTRKGILGEGSKASITQSEAWSLALIQVFGRTAGVAKCRESTRINIDLCVLECNTGEMLWNNGIYKHK
jgi:hypothetical protein